MDQNMLKTWKWPGIFFRKDAGNPVYGSDLKQINSALVFMKIQEAR